MNKNSVICTEDTSLEKVFELMTENDSDYVSVVESNAHQMPLGMITEHDICLQIVGRGRNPRGMTAAAVMNTKVVKASSDSSLHECLNLLRIKSAQRLFIVNEDGMLCGTISRPEIEKFAGKPLTEKRIGATVIYS